jgi:hypothetical protein
LGFLLWVFTGEKDGFMGWFERKGKYDLFLENKKIRLYYIQNYIEIYMIEDISE